jgi:hypothetical protein
VYIRNDDPMKDYVHDALARYKKDSNDVAAGYNILRYAAQGLLIADNNTNPNVFVDWYPANQGYTLLRLAKQGKLSYNGKGRQ